MPVQVSNVKAADPGVAFTLEVPANEPPLGTSIRAVVKIKDPNLLTDYGEGLYTSEVWARDPINDRIMKCMAPFGDNAYSPGRILQFTIDLYMPCDAKDYKFQQNGEVMATSGRFDLGSNMIIKLKDHGGIHAGVATNGMPMMESEDGSYIGILHPDGNFIIYPQYVFGEGKKMDPTYISDTKAERRIAGHPVSIFVSDGRAHFFANNQNLFVSEEQLVGADVVIGQDGFYLTKPGSVIVGPEKIGPLKFKEV
ncbi:MAG: hypothetical protein IT262_21065 [Saprospiraceae bacterium]|nr:hypothetical protein [Saprospiraceae bacterium]